MLRPDTAKRLCRSRAVGKPTWSDGSAEEAGIDGMRARTTRVSRNAKTWRSNRPRAGIRNADGMIRAKKPSSEEQSGRNPTRVEEPPL